MAIPSSASPLDTATVLTVVVDLGVNPDKSTPVDLGIRSRVGSILLGAVEFKTRSDFI